jgi:hypothetical protein
MEPRDDPAPCSVAAVERGVQAAVIGTPDPGPDNGTTDCNTTAMTSTLPEDPVATGSRSNCKSARGAFDVVDPGEGGVVAER